LLGSLFIGSFRVSLAALCAVMRDSKKNPPKFLWTRGLLLPTFPRDVGEIKTYHIISKTAVCLEGRARRQITSNPEWKI